MNELTRQQAIHFQGPSRALSTRPVGWRSPCPQGTGWGHGLGYSAQRSTQEVTVFRAKKDRTEIIPAAVLLSCDTPPITSDPNRGNTPDVLFRHAYPAEPSPDPIRCGVGTSGGVVVARLRSRTSSPTAVGRDNPRAFRGGGHMAYASPLTQPLSRGLVRSGGLRREQHEGPSTGRQFSRSASSF